MMRWGCKGVSSNILLRIKTNEVKSEVSECGDIGDMEFGLWWYFVGRDFGFNY